MECYENKTKLSSREIDVTEILVYIIYLVKNNIVKYKMAIELLLVRNNSFITKNISRRFDPKIGSSSVQ